MGDQVKVLIISNLEKQDKSSFQNFRLIPDPKEIRYYDENFAFKITANSNISLVNVLNEKLFIDDFNAFLTSISKIIINKNQNALYETEKVFKTKIRIRDLISINNEEVYNIEITDGKIIIFSIHERGLFYGLQTLIQLLKNLYPSNNEFTLPSMRIRDCPDLKIRGVAQDISRGQVFTIENAKRYIRIISHYKMNFYCVYIEDMFAHPNHPNIGKNRGVLTGEEIGEIDKFAKERFIEFIPIFESLGHVDNILAHKEYENLAEYPGSQCLNISNPQIYKFLEDYISEMSKSFSSTYFHIGCDESFDFGKYRSVEFIKKVGKDQAYIDFYEKLYEMVRSYGKHNVIMYDDIVVNDKKILKDLNKDLIIMLWDYRPKKKYPKVEKLLKAGYKVIVSPSMLNWQRNFPDNKNAKKNIYYLIKTAYNKREAGCLGVLTCTWGDFRYYTLRENEIYGAILTSELAWSFKPYNYDDFNKKFGFLFYGITEQYLNQFNELYTTLSSSASLYKKLAILLPPFFFTYLFKHPFPTGTYKPSCKNYDKLEELGKNCIKLCEKLEDYVKFEKDNFEFVKFGAELAKILGEKLRISSNISKFLNKNKINQESILRCISDIEYIKDKFEYLKNRYEKLWLRAAKRPCLDFNLKLFDFVIDCYEKKIIQLKNGIFYEDPYIPSEWIWVKESICPKLPRYFRKSFQINSAIKKVMLQGIACNYMKIYINSKLVGEVFSRFSLSILPIYNRVKVFDITKYVNLGDNIIAIEAYNYDGYKGAINVYLQILYDDNTIQEIFSEKNWNCRKNLDLNDDSWKLLDYNDEEWEPAKSYGRPPKLNGDIFKPYLLNGEVSMTQDYFGLEGFFFNAMTTLITYFYGKLKRFIGKIFIRLFKSIVHLLIKRLKPFD
ncbi:MAG: family 20 glycosylhydrolase [Promethearchaeota archaeon]